jgi:D-alanyl-D-alanine carboxypeptidase
VTKLFTALAVMESDKKDEEFSIIASDMHTEGRAGKLVAGTKTTLYDLLFPLLIESSNDAGVAISRYMGPMFMDSIQKTLESQSLAHTRIVEPTGLSPKNISTVRDLAVFYAYVHKNHPHVLDITELYTYIDEHTGYGNSNPARKFSSFSGGKQGYTDEAGKTFVGTFMVSNSGKEIGIVLLKSSDLLEDIEHILVYAESITNTSDILVP